MSNSLLEIEHSLLTSEFAAVETLLALIPPKGTLAEVVFLPREQALRALKAAMAVRWLL